MADRGRGRRGRGGRGGWRRAREDDEDGHRTALGTGVKPLSGGGGIFKSAAVAVLRRERKLMTTGEITRVALETGLIKCQGKTPEATMASALYTDVKRKLDKSVFTRPQEGLFGLREWLDEGYYPEGWVGPTDGGAAGLAPFKRRVPGGPGRGRAMPGRPSKGRASSAWRGSDDYDDEEEEEEEAMYDYDDEYDEAAGEDMDVDHAEEDVEGDDDSAASLSQHTPGDSRRGRPRLDRHPNSSIRRRGGGSRMGIIHQDLTLGQASAADANAAAAAAVDMNAAAAAAAAVVAASMARAGGLQPTDLSIAGAHGGVPQPPMPHAVLDLGGLPRREDDLDSPLHVLGDAVLSKSRDGGVGGVLGPGSGGAGASSWRKGSKRERERPAHIQVPLGSTLSGTAAAATVGPFTADGLLAREHGIVSRALTPKSPYEDSLAALHEIATSPASYAPAGIMDVAGGGSSRDGDPGSGKRRKPRLMVDVQSGQVDGMDQRGLTTNGLPMLPTPTPSALFMGLDTPLADALAGSALLNPGQAAGQAGGVAKAGAAGRGPLPPVISIPALPSPAVGYIDTPALMALQDVVLAPTPGLIGGLTAATPAGGTSLFSPHTILQIPALAAPTPRGTAGALDPIAAAAAGLSSTVLAPLAQAGKPGEVLTRLDPLGRLEAGGAAAAAAMQILGSANRSAAAAAVEAAGSGLLPMPRPLNLHGFAAAAGLAAAAAGGVQGAGAGGAAAGAPALMVSGVALNPLAAAAMSGGNGLAAAAAGANGAGVAPAAAGAGNENDSSRRMAEVMQMQAVVEKLEGKLGRSHPQVGKGWLALARMYQHVIPVAGAAAAHKALHALEHARAACLECARSLGLSLSSGAEFDYLERHLKQLAADGKQGSEAQQQAESGGQQQQQQQGEPQPEGGQQLQQGSSEPQGAPAEQQQTAAASEGCKQAASAEAQAQRDAILMPPPPAPEVVTH